MRTPLILPLVAGIAVPATLIAAITPSEEFPVSTGAADADQPVAVVVDPSGGVVVTRVNYVAGEGANYLTSRFVGGKVAWTRSYNGPASLNDEPAALAIDGAGNVYVTGRSRASRGSDLATVKYGPAGEPLWSVRHGDGETGAATALAVGADGAVYVAGHVDREGGLPEAQLLLKYSASGQLLRVTHLGEESVPGFDLSPTSLAVDPSGRVLVAGASAGLREHFDMEVALLDPDGKVLARAHSGGPGISQDFPASVAFGPDGSFFLAGSGIVEGVPEADMFISRFGRDGTRLWTSRYGSPGGGVDAVVGMIPGAVGDILVLGSTHVIGTNGLALFRLDAQGVRVGGLEEAAGIPMAMAASNALVPGEVHLATLRPGVGGAGPTVATFRASVPVPSRLPQITAIPQGLMFVPGEAGSLVVQAESATGFQWFLDGVAVPGANQATYAPGDRVGDYTVRVSNPSGAVVSPVARVALGEGLHGAAFGADGGFHAWLNGEAGRIYELQFSDDLRSWTTLATQRSAGVPTEVTDPPRIGIPSRYFRARRFL